MGEDKAARVLDPVLEIFEAVDDRLDVPPDQGVVVFQREPGSFRRVGQWEVVTVSEELMGEFTTAGIPTALVLGLVTVSLDSSMLCNGAFEAM